MSRKLEIIRQFLETHRASLAAGVTAVIMLALVARNQADFNKFLKSKGLLDEYYSLED